MSIKVTEQKVGSRFGFTDSFLALFFDALPPPVFRSPPSTLPFGDISRPHCESTLNFQFCRRRLSGERKCPAGSSHGPHVFHFFVRLAHDKVSMFSARLHHMESEAHKTKTMGSGRGRGGYCSRLLSTVHLNIWRRPRRSFSTRCPVSRPVPAAQRGRQ